MKKPHWALTREELIEDLKAICDEQIRSAGSRGFIVTPESRMLAMRWIEILVAESPGLDPTKWDESKSDDDIRRDYDAAVKQEELMRKYPREFAAWFSIIKLAGPRHAPLLSSFN